MSEIVSVDGAGEWTEAFRNHKDSNIVLFNDSGNEHTQSKYNDYIKVYITMEPSPRALPCDKWVHCCRTPGTYYYPYYALSFVERTDKPEELLNRVHYPKTKFCAFMYNQRHEHREDLFRKLSSYKQVDGLSKSCSTMPVQPSLFRPFDNAVERYKPYKFVISCENSIQPGYITEKIISAMLANTIPIYWGTQDISTHFNPKSFIQVTRDDAWIQRVIELDNNDDLYRQMQNEPWFVDNKLNTFLRPDFDPLERMTLQADIDKINENNSSQNIQNTEKQQPDTEKTNTEDATQIQIQTSSDDWTLVLIILIICVVVIFCVGTYFYYRTPTGIKFGKPIKHK